MAHSICITYNYCREGSHSGFYAIPKSKGWRRLMKECRRYIDSTAWIMNFHENRRAA